MKFTLAGAYPCGHGPPPECAICATVIVLGCADFDSPSCCVECHDRAQRVATWYPGADRKLAADVCCKMRNTLAAANRGVWLAALKRHVARTSVA